MAWISVHDTVIGLKLRKLEKTLVTTREEALGILMELWLWGLNNADKNGRLINADKEDVREAFTAKVLYKMSNVDVVGALIQTGWIDEEESGNLKIHDWDVWQKQWYDTLERRAKDAERKAAERAGEKAAKGESPEKASASAAAEIEQKANASRKRREYPTDFEEFYATYPRRIGKADAYDKWKARINDGFPPEMLISAGKRYATMCKKSGTEETYIMHPKRFLGPNTPFLDYLPKERKKEEQVQPGTNPFAEWKE